MDQSTDMADRRAERLAKVKRDQGQPMAAQEAPSASRRPSAASKARWVTYNTFVDLVAPRLTLAEREVWNRMFRHTRNGICETSVRQLATDANIGRATAERALRQLCEYGLVWPVWKSRDRSKASKYGLHDHPELCLGRIPERGKPSSQ